MVISKNIQEFIESICESNIVIDVRSPSEYTHAHIPNAINIPLFSDEERAVVGTAYKHESREEAIKLGLDYFGPKMRAMVEEVEKSVEDFDKNHKVSNVKSKTVMVYCWRGGMRSGAVSWLLGLYGYEVIKLEGGYKVFRNWALDQFKRTYNLKVLGGYTGAGKTVHLHNMETKGEIVIDLEGLASHKGSSFGHIGLPDQPSQEMFENMLALQLYHLRNEMIWVEDESQRIGEVRIPKGIYDQMTEAPILFLEVSQEQRVDNIIQEYGSLPKQKLKEGILRIQKRLGGLETKNAIEHLEKDDFKSCFTILIRYYDKWYDKAMQKKLALKAQ